MLPVVLFLSVSTAIFLFHFLLAFKFIAEYSSHISLLQLTYYTFSSQNYPLAFDPFYYRLHLFAICLAHHTEKYVYPKTKKICEARISRFI